MATFTATYPADLITVSIWLLYVKTLSQYTTDYCDDLGEVFLAFSL